MLCLNLGMLLHVKLTLWVAVQMWVSDCTTSVIHLIHILIKTVHLQTPKSLFQFISKLCVSALLLRKPRYSGTIS